MSLEIQRFKLRINGRTREFVNLLADTGTFIFKMIKKLIFFKDVINPYLCRIVTFYNFLTVNRN